MTIDSAAVRLAVLGLRFAYTRHHAVARGGQQNEDAMIISAVDFVNWTCALDELLAENDLGYASRRDSDPDGRVIVGLRYVRDRHMHQVVVSMRGDGVSFFAAFPPRLSAGVVWRPANEMAQPVGKHATTANVRRAAYDQHLQMRPAWVSLAAALRFLTSEVTSLQVALPAWIWPAEQ